MTRVWRGCLIKVCFIQHLVGRRTPHALPMERMRPPRNSPWWSSCMLSSARHFSLGKKHFSLGFRHFSLGCPVRKVANTNGFRGMPFPNRLNNRLLKGIGDYAMLRPYADWKRIGRSLRGGLEIVFLLYWGMRILFAEMCRPRDGLKNGVSCCNYWHLFYFLL